MIATVKGSVVDRPYPVKTAHVEGVEFLVELREVVEGHAMFELVTVRLVGAPSLAAFVTQYFRTATPITAEGELMVDENDGLILDASMVSYVHPRIAP